MKIIDCIWEIPNIHKRTCEIIIDNEDSNEDILTIDRNTSEFEYKVVKACDKSVPVYKALSSQGFYFVENQISITFRGHNKQRMSKVSSRFYERIELRPCLTQTSIEFVLNQINNDLFYTDRIALDPSFGVKYANIRYSNWIKNTIEKDKYELYEILVSGQAVGFAYFFIDGSKVDYLLAGLYKEYQSSGFGIAIPLASVRFMEQHSFKRIETSISSNNLNIVRCYFECGFDMLNMSYVFAKNCENITKITPHTP